MSRALAEETRTEQLGNHTISSEDPHESMCTRCGGLMVTDFCMDLLFCIGETEFAAQHCVQCGEIVDPIILRNRGITEDPKTGPAGVDDRLGEVMQSDNRSKKTEQVSFLHRGRRHESSRRLPLR